MSAHVQNTNVQRPAGFNADEWHAFLLENVYCGCGDGFISGLEFIAVQIATAIEEAELRRVEKERAS
jgi:hypothetical protein